MNILIKLTCLIGLVIAPILGGHTADHATKEDTKKEIILEEAPSIPSEAGSGVQEGEVLEF